MKLRLITVVWNRSRPWPPDGWVAAPSAGATRYAPPGGWGDDEAIGAQRGQEQFEIAGLIERPFGNDRNFPLHARIDDEGAPRRARHILDEGAHIGIAQIDRLLRQHRGGDQQDCQEGRGELAGHFLSCRGGAALAALPD